MKSFKFKDNNYLDSNGIVHNKKILSNFLSSENWIQLNSNYNTFYRKTGNNVELNVSIYVEKGLLIGDYGTVVLGTLREGYRPPKNIIVPVFSMTTDNSSVSPIRLNVKTSGEVSLYCWGSKRNLQSVTAYINYFI